MKPHRRLRSALAGIGLVSLLVYVLACTSFTSFSPDDSKILYPAFDAASGAVSVAVFDRKSGKSEIVYVSPRVAEKDDDKVDRLPIRADWLPDGKHILVGAPTSEEKGLSLLLVPYGVREPVRAISVPDPEKAGVLLLYRFALADSRLLFGDGDNTTAFAIDLLTGETLQRDYDAGVFFLPTANGKPAFWQAGKEVEGEETGPVTYGLVDPASLELKPRGQIPAELGGDGGAAPCIGREAAKVALADKAEDQLKVVVIQEGKIVVSRAIEHGTDEVVIGPHMDFSPGEDRIYAPYRLRFGDEKPAEVGLLEIPLDGSPLRWTPLLSAVLKDDENMLVFQGGLSHDGKTWAVASSSLYRKAGTLRTEDCALFMVDLRDSKRTVTKVPIAPPPAVQASASK